MIRWMTAALAAASVAGCTMADTPPDTAVAPAPVATSAPGGASAVLRMADGTEVGRAVATEANGGVRVMVDASKLPAGVHGVHVHTTGRCDGPDFTTAGGHWNPTTMKHGTQNPMGPHAGDMPNLTAGADGRGTVSVTLPAGTMAGLMDADGAAFIIHAGPDDMKTDPAGNSGGRIACGVFEAS